MHISNINNNWKLEINLGGLSFYQINFIAMGITFKIYIFVSKIN